MVMAYELKCRAYELKLKCSPSMIPPSYLVYAHVYTHVYTNVYTRVYTSVYTRVYIHAR